MVGEGLGLELGLGLPLKNRITIVNRMPALELCGREIGNLSNDSNWDSVFRLD